jgi:two-component system chemotaxis response regulator CheB
VLAIGASAGGVEPLSEIVQLLPLSLALSVLIVVHINPSRPSLLATLLGRVSDYDVTEAVEAEPLEAGHIYVAPPDHHLTVVQERVRLTRHPRENRARPAADPLFRSLARWYGPFSIGLVLSGMRNDGASGLAELHRSGGLALVQNPEEALFPPMPEAAIRVVEPKVLDTPKEIVQAVEETARANMDDDRSHARKAGFQIVNDDLTQDEEAAEDRAEVPQERDLTGLQCPECGGSLWQRSENDGPLYRCRVGHSLSTEALDEAQLDALESTLWGVVVSLEERADFLRRHQAEGKRHARDHWSEEIQEIEVRAAQLRELITTVFVAGPSFESA